MTEMKTLTIYWQNRQQLNDFLGTIDVSHHLFSLKSKCVQFFWANKTKKKRKKKKNVFTFATKMNVVVGAIYCVSFSSIYIAEDKTLKIALISRRFRSWKMAKNPAKLKQSVWFVSIYFIFSSSKIMGDRNVLRESCSCMIRNLQFNIEYCRIRFFHAQRAQTQDSDWEHCARKPTKQKRTWNVMTAKIRSPIGMWTFFSFSPLTFFCFWDDLSTVSTSFIFSIAILFISTSEYGWISTVCLIRFDYIVVSGEDVIFSFFFFLLLWLLLFLWQPYHVVSQQKMYFYELLRWND